MASAIAFFLKKDCKKFGGLKYLPYICTRKSKGMAP